MRPLTLSALNALDPQGFAAALGFLFERSPWVAERAHAAAPFLDREAVLAALMSVLNDAAPAERLAVIRAHPELAGKAAVAGDLTAESRSEQAGAGLDRLTPEEFERFHVLNAAYQARFAFPFVICVRLTDKVGILEAMGARLSNSPDVEAAAAIREIGLIARLRLFDVLVDDAEDASA